MRFRVPQCDDVQAIFKLKVWPCSTLSVSSLSTLFVMTSENSPYSLCDASLPSIHAYSYDHVLAPVCQCSEMAVSLHVHELWSQPRVDVHWPSRDTCNQTNWPNVTRLTLSWVQNRDFIKTPLSFPGLILLFTFSRIFYRLRSRRFGTINSLLCPSKAAFGLFAILEVHYKECRSTVWFQVILWNL